MTVTDYTRVHKNLLTIEISPTHQIVQCRGKANRLADRYEWSLIERFALDRNLDISLDGFLMDKLLQINLTYRYLLEQILSN